MKALKALYEQGKIGWELKITSKDDSGPKGAAGLPTMVLIQLHLIFTHKLIESLEKGKCSMAIFSSVRLWPYSFLVCYERGGVGDDGNLTRVAAIQNRMSIFCPILYPIGK